MGDELFNSLTKEIKDNKKWSVIIIFVICTIIPGAFFLGFLYPSFIAKSDIFKIILYSCTITLPLTGTNLFIDSAWSLRFEKKESDFDFMLIGNLITQSFMTIITIFVLSLTGCNFNSNKSSIYTWHFIFWLVFYTIERRITRKRLAKKPTSN